MAKVYSLKKRRDTEEYHLFRAEPSTEGRCKPESLSICEKMELEEDIEKRFSCQSKSNARLRCAEIGDQVCGICVSSLYLTIP